MGLRYRLVSRLQLYTILVQVSVCQINSLPEYLQLNPRDVSKHGVSGK